MKTRASRFEGIWEPQLYVLAWNIITAVWPEYDGNKILLTGSQNVLPRLALHSSLHSDDGNVVIVTGIETGNNTLIFDGIVIQMAVHIPNASSWILSVEYPKRKAEILPIEE